MGPLRSSNSLSGGGSTARIEPLTSHLTPYNSRTSGFAVLGSVRLEGPGRPAVAQQRFVPDESYLAARRGALTVDKFASRRRFEGWGGWAQARIKVSDW